MRILCSTVLAFLLLATLLLPAAHARTGIGIVAGEPSGFSVKQWLDEETAIDGAIGWSLGDGDIYLHADYLWHRTIEDTKIGGTAPAYYGVGARLLLQDGGDSKFGIRIPGGLDYLFDDGRFDVFVEIAPIFNFVPETEFDLSIGVGARYYF